MNPLKKIAAHFGLRPKMHKPQPAEPEVLGNTSKPAVGLFRLLTAEQQAKALNTKEDESFGPEEFALKGTRYAAAN